MNPEKKTFYITTPIYYPSDKLHIGHTYCTVATDAMARYKRLTGYDVMFLTGTDEHGQKIEDKAREAGVSPKEFVDRIVEGPQGVKDLWKLMNISNDRFIRTTDDYHVSAIQKIFKAMYDNGDIYKGKYVGKYCKPCESFWTESQLKDGCCPDCGRPVVDAEEEAYFFRLSKYADKIQDLLGKLREPGDIRQEILDSPSKIRLLPMAPENQAADVNAVFFPDIPGLLRKFRLIPRFHNGRHFSGGFVRVGVRRRHMVVVPAPPRGGHRDHVVPHGEVNGLVLGNQALAVVLLHIGIVIILHQLVAVRFHPLAGQMDTIRRFAAFLVANRLLHVLSLVHRKNPLS